MSFIKKMMEKEAEKSPSFREYTKEELTNAKYILYTVRIGSLYQKGLNAKEDVKILKKDAIMVNVATYWYMDIETGKYYQFGGDNGEEVAKIKGKTYVGNLRPMFHTCYETIMDKHFNCNQMLTAKQLNELYQDHLNRWETTEEY